MQESLPPPLLLVGLDRGNQNYQFCIIDPTGKKLEEGVLSNETKTAHPYSAQIRVKAALRSPSDYRFSPG